MANDNNVLNVSFPLIPLPIKEAIHIKAKVVKSDLVILPFPLIPLPIKEAICKYTGCQLFPS